MAEITVSRRLREARSAREEDLATLAQRIGVREENLRAIEQERFADLPAGIYGRAAIKAFAAGYGFDPVEMLAACEHMLRSVEEPISALGRLRGVRQRVPVPPSQSHHAEAERSSLSRFWPVLPAGCPSWRLMAAVTADAAVIGCLLAGVAICAITAMTVPIAALHRTGPAFALMGLLMAAGYFVWFGGLRGATFGEQLLAVGSPRTVPGALTLQAIALRALLAATADARFIHGLGAWVGLLIAHGHPTIGEDDLPGIEQPASR